MSSTSLLPVFALLCLGYLYTTTAQVSFSTHWGTGKRAAMFKTQPESNQRPPLFDTHRETVPPFLRSNDEILQCLSKLEVNVLKYISFVLENEIRLAKKCIQGEPEVEYD